MYIGNMNFNDRGLYSCNCITYCNRSVCIAGRIQYNTIATEPCFLYFINEFAFNVTLIISKLNLGKFLF